LSYSDIIQHANSPQEGPFLRGITPLCLAAYLGKVDIVGKLIDMGVSVDSIDKNGKRVNLKIRGFCANVCC
jgi:hypothetical protein